VTQLLKAPAHISVYITAKSLRILYCTLAGETGDNKGLNETNFYAPSVTGTCRRTDNHNLPLPHFLKRIALLYTSVQYISLLISIRKSPVQIITSSMPPRFPWKRPGNKTTRVRVLLHTPCHLTSHTESLHKPHSDVQNAD